jgi:transposase-like protein
VTRYVPEYEKRWNRFSRTVGTSWRVDETYISIKAKWHYLYRAVDKQGKTVKVRTNKYLNNMIEQDHRAIKRRCASMAGFKTFANAATTIAGIELAHRIRKGQFSFGRGRRRRDWSRKAEWAMAVA